MNPTKERLQKKLSIIKILSKNKGMTLENLAKYTNRTKQEITKDLGELFMVGAYPYTPADYLEIDFDGNSLTLNSPVSIEKSIGLSSAEWLAIRNLIDLELEENKGNLEEKILFSIREKIKKIVPYSEYKNYEKTKTILREAIHHKKSIEFIYTGRKDEAPEKRKVDPWVLFREKNDYLAAYCHVREGIRTFRLESIVDPVITSESFKQSPNEEQIEKHLQAFRSFLERNSSESQFAEILIQKNAFYNLSNQLEIEILSEKFIYKNKEYIQAKARIIYTDWFLDIVKSFGNSVFILSPVELKEKILIDLQNVKIPVLQD